MSLVDEEKIWSEFLQIPYDHPLIPFNAIAGSSTYRFSPTQKPKNNIEIKAPQISKDQTKVLQRAIDKIAEMGGGEILLGTGIFPIHGRIHLHGSSLRLVGAGAGKTVLKFLRPLSELAPLPLEPNGASAYSWNAGLLHIGPKEDFQGSDLKQISGWGAKGEIAFTIGEAKRGDRSIAVSDASKILAGDWIFLSYENPESHKLLNEVAGFSNKENFDWKKNGKAWVRRAFPWPIQVKSVSKNTLFLTQPLRIGFGKDWGAKIQKFVPIIEKSGVENLSIEMDSGREKAHLQELGFNAIFFHRAIDSWLSNVEIKNADSGVILNATKNISLDRVFINGSRQYHHAFFTKNTHDALISNFEINAPVIHGINADLFGSGNVWSEGKMLHGTFDMHRGMQFDLIRTSIDIFNDGQAGGETNAGPMQGRRVVHWNIRYKNKDSLVNQPEYFKSGLLLGLFRETDQRVEHDICQLESNENALKRKNLYLEQRKLQESNSTAN